MSARKANGTSAMRLRFGGFTLVGETELRTAAGRVALQPQPLRLLAALARRPGEIVTRDELRRALWGDVHVDHEHGLNFAVRQLRVALADTPEAPRFVETVPKVGYRFMAPVQVDDDARDVRSDTPSPPAAPRSPWTAVAAAVAVGAAAATLLVAPTAHTTPRVLVRPFAGAAIMTEGVVRELARVPSLSVVVSSNDAPPASGVTHVVEGHARGAMIEARLVDAADDRVVWAGDVDAHAPLGAGRLARDVALALRPTASASPQHGHLREGWRLLRQGSADDAERALAQFETAARIAPRSAEAQIGLAESWRRLARPTRETSAAWRASAERAIALDADDARGHLSLAGYRLYREGDLEGSRTAFERAFALSPGLAAVPDAYAAWYAMQGRHEEALALGRRAVELDPLALNLQLDLGWYLYLARRYDESAVALERAFALGGTPSCLDYALRARVAAGEWDAARTLALRVMDLRAADTAATARVRDAPDAGTAVRGHLRWNLERVRARKTAPGVLAMEYAWLGEDDSALRLLQDDAAEGGTWTLRFLNVDPAWDGLRARAEFRALAGRFSPPWSGPAS